MAAVAGVAVSIAIVVAVTPLASGGLTAASFDESAAELMARIAVAQRTRGFTMRAKLTVERAGSPSVSVVQIRAAGRRDGTTSLVLYQALGPDTLRGRAVVLEKPDRQRAGGFLFAPPDAVTPLTRARLTERVFDSDLTVEDLSDDYLDWPRPAFVTDDKVGNDACRVVESMPPRNAESTYVRVRSCVSISKLLILRIEKIRSGGRVAKRIVVRRTARANDGTVAPRTVEIDDIEHRSKTTLEVSRGDRDVVVAPEEFSIERLKRLK